MYTLPKIRSACAQAARFSAAVRAPHPHYPTISTIGFFCVSSVIANDSIGKIKVSSTIKKELTVFG